MPEEETLDQAPNNLIGIEHEPTQEGAIGDAPPTEEELNTAQNSFVEGISGTIKTHANDVPLVIMAKILQGVVTDLIVRQSAMQTQYAVQQLIEQVRAQEETKSKIHRV